MDHICAHLDHYQQSAKKYQIKGRKGQIYTIVDGYFQYLVNLDPQPQCQCRGLHCHHVLHVLTAYYQLDSDLLGYVLTIPNLYGHFLTSAYVCSYADLEELSRSLWQEVDKFFDSDNCGICLDKLNAPQFHRHLDFCPTCQKWSHQTCLSKWVKTQNLRDTACIYCRQ